MSAPAVAGDEADDDVHLGGALVWAPADAPPPRRRGLASLASRRRTPRDDGDAQTVGARSAGRRRASSRRDDGDAQTVGARSVRSARSARSTARSIRSLAGAGSQTGRAAAGALLRSLGAGVASAQAVATAMTGSSGNDAGEAETVGGEGEAAPRRAERPPGTRVRWEEEEAQARRRAARQERRTGGPGGGGPPAAADAVLARTRAFLEDPDAWLQEERLRRQREQQRRQREAAAAARARLAGRRRHSAPAVPRLGGPVEAEARGQRQPGRSAPAALSRRPPAKAVAAAAAAETGEGQEERRDEVPTPTAAAEVAGAAAAPAAWYAPAEAYVPAAGHGPAAAEARRVVVAEPRGGEDEEAPARAGGRPPGKRAGPDDGVTRAAGRDGPRRSSLDSEETNVIGGRYTNRHRRVSVLTMSGDGDGDGDSDSDSDSADMSSALETAALDCVDEREGSGEDDDPASEGSSVDRRAAHVAGQGRRAECAGRALVSSVGGGGKGSHAAHERGREDAGEEGSCCDDSFSDVGGGEEEEEGQDATMSQARFLAIYQASSRRMQLQAEEDDKGEVTHEGKEGRESLAAPDRVRVEEYEEATISDATGDGEGCDTRDRARYAQSERGSLDSRHSNANAGGADDTNVHSRELVAILRENMRALLRESSRQLSHADKLREISRLAALAQREKEDGDDPDGNGAEVRGASASDRGRPLSSSAIGSGNGEGDNNNNKATMSNKANPDSANMAVNCSRRMSSRAMLDGVDMGSPGDGVTDRPSSQSVRSDRSTDSAGNLRESTRTLQEGSLRDAEMAREDKDAGRWPQCSTSASSGRSLVAERVLEASRRGEDRANARAGEGDDQENSAKGGKRRRKKKKIKSTHSKQIQLVVEGSAKNAINDGAGGQDAVDQMPLATELLTAANFDSLMLSDHTSDSIALRLRGDVSSLGSRVSSVDSSSGKHRDPGCLRAAAAAKFQKGMDCARDGCYALARSKFRGALKIRLRLHKNPGHPSLAPVVRTSILPHYLQIRTVGFSLSILFT